MKTNRQIACGTCGVPNRVEPVATRFMCSGCGAQNTVSAEARETALRRARMGAILTVTGAIVITIWIFANWGQGPAP